MVPEARLAHLPAISKPEGRVCKFVTEEEIAKRSYQRRSDANAMNLQSGVAFRASGIAKVIAQEQVTTAAGTLRIGSTPR